MKPVLLQLLYLHPGLQFLEATPEFQERYADTVNVRIFWSYDFHDRGYLTLHDFRKTNIYEIFMKVDEEEDINNVRELFSYEHF